MLTILIKSNRDQIFCTDNEAFRLVCAHFSGARFNDVDFESFAGSWRQSAQETHRFIEFAAKQRPHQVADMLSVNKARTIIYNLARPLANVNELIESKIRVFDDRKNDLQSTVANLDDLKKKLMIPQISIEVKPLNYPKTVCSATKCIDTIALPYTNQQQTVYNQICHDHCYLSGVDVEKSPEPHLRRCAAMNGENCGVCKCSWKNHMHIRFEQIKTSIATEDKNTKALIEQKSDATKVKEHMIKGCEDEVNELKAEQQKIIKTSLRFGSFLQANAILPYNDAFEKYVEQSIAEEEKCVSVGGNRTKLDSLRKLLKEYREERRMLLEAQKNPQRDGGNTIAPDEIEMLKAELFSLKNTGKTLQSLFAATEDGLAKHQSFTTVKWQRPKEIQPANYGRYRDNLRDVKEKPGTSKTENPQKSQKEAKGSKKGKAKKN